MKLLYGGTGTGKTSTLIKEYKKMIDEGISSNEILVLLMNRNQSLEWRRQIDLEVSSKLIRTSFFGFVQEEISLFYPIVLEKCEDIKKYSVSPVFLTFEVSQYLLAKIIEQKRLFGGGFSEVTAQDSKIAIDISSNLVKAASAMIPYQNIGDRLYNSLELKTEEKRNLFKTADKVMADYRKRCLECGVIDFSMAIDLYNNVLLKSQEYVASLQNRIKYLIVDNLEEAVPAEIDLIAKLIPLLKGGIIAYNPEGGYGTIFGANRKYAEERILERCEVIKTDNLPYTCSSAMVEFSDMLFDCIIKQKSKANKTTEIVRFPEVNLRAEMLSNVANFVKSEINKGTDPNDIALISTYADPVTEYVIESALLKENINLINISRKDKFIDNKFVHALITLGVLCHPDEKTIPNRDDVKMLVMMVLNMDPIRSSILAGIICSQNPFAMFPEVECEGVIDRIGYSNIAKYEFIRNWINDYRNGEQLPIDKFFQKVFTEVLLVYGANEKDIINIKKLIDSAKKFRETIVKFNTIDVNREFLKMIKNNVKAAESIFEMEEKAEMNGVTLATPMTYLGSSLNHKVIVLIGLSSSHWIPRCAKELSNPYVLTTTWKDDDIYSEEEEAKRQKENIAILIRALLKRCSEKFVTFESRYSGDGYENDGMLPEFFCVEN